MQEYEIYLPTTLNDGASVEAAKIQGIKDTLVKAFSGYTVLEPSVGRRVVHGRGDFS